jgi:hypothetical protein
LPPAPAREELARIAAGLRPRRTDIWNHGYLMLKPDRRTVTRRNWLMLGTDREKRWRATADHITRLLEAGYPDDDVAKILIKNLRNSGRVGCREFVIVHAWMLVASVNVDAQAGAPPPPRGEVAAEVANRRVLDSNLASIKSQALTALQPGRGDPNAGRGNHHAEFNYAESARRILEAIDPRCHAGKGVHMSLEAAIRQLVRDDRSAAARLGRALAAQPALARLVTDLFAMTVFGGGIIGHRSSRTREQVLKSIVDNPLLQELQG